MDPVRVSFVIDSLGAGGAEYSLVEMIPRLSERGIELSVVALRRSDEGFEEHLRQAGAVVRFLQGESWLRRLLELRRLIRSHSPDLVHTTLFQADVLGRLAAVGTGVPVVSSLVNVSYEDARLADPNVRRWRVRGVQAIDALTARFFTKGFHAISHTVAASAGRRLRIHADRVTVIPRSRDQGRLAAADPGHRRLTRSGLGIPNDAAVILTLGRQEFQKGQRHLVEAFSQLAVRRPNVWLVIAGRRGNATEELQRTRQAATGSSRILILGHRTDVPDLLGAADLFAFPSLYEGLGGALLEAMGAGLPIVASDIPAIREMMGGAALLVPPGDAERLRAEIDRLLESVELRMRMGTAARERFQRSPPADEIAERTATWYRRMTGPRTSRT